MTPEEAAEGRRLLERWNNYAGTARGIISGHGSQLSDWLWTNREALVRCAELAAERATPTETAHCDGCGTSVERCNAFPPPAIKCCPDCKHVPDPRLANPPGPMGGRMVEAPACCAIVEPFGSTLFCELPLGHDGPHNCEAKGSPHKPEGE